MENNLKLNVLIIIFLMFNINIYVVAQYTHNDFLNTGDSVLISSAQITSNAYNFDTTGINIVWNFSTLTASSQEMLRFQSPNNFGYKLPWCISNGFIFNCNANFNSLTNMAVLNSADTINLGALSAQNFVSHYTKSTNGFVHTMDGRQITIGLPISLAQEFSIKDTLFRFPVTYNDNYQTTNLKELDLTSFGFPYERKTYQNKQHNVEASGTIITPYGSFNNALKLRTEITTIDTVWINSTQIPVTTLSVEYRWFASQLPYPVLEAFGTIVLGSEVITSIKYIDSVRCTTPNPLFSYLPIIPEIDSASGTATVNTINLSSSANSYKWIYNNQSDSSTQKSPILNFACSGWNNITLIAKNTCNSSLSDTLMLPIYISDTLGISNIDTSITKLSDTLYLPPNNYRNIYWMDCNTNMIVDSNINYFVPTVSGLYKAIISKGNCVKQSECHSVNNLTTGLESQIAYNTISIYPNPTDNYFSIETTKEISRIYLYNTQGKLIKTYSSRLVYQLPEDIERGVYIVKIVNQDGGVYSKRIVIN